MNVRLLRTPLLFFTLLLALTTARPGYAAPGPLPSHKISPNNISPALFHHTSVQVWNTSSGLPQDTVHQFLQTRDGFLWMATDGGLVRFDGYDFTVYDRRSTSPQIFSSDLVNALFEDAASHLWIATADGLLERTGNTFRRYGMRDGLPAETIWAVGQDHLGRIWVATTSGLACLDSGKFTAHPESGSFDGRLQAPMVSAPDGSLWVVSAHSAARIDPAGQLTVTPLPNAAVDIAASPDSALWIATAHALLRVDRNRTVVPTLLPSDLSGAQIRSLVWDHASTLWIGTTSGLFSSQSPAWERPGWHHYTQQLASSANPGGDRISRVRMDRGGDLSVVTDAGLAVFSHDQFSSLFEQDGFRGTAVLALYQDRDGDQWLGSENSGAAILRHSPFATLTSREGLPTDVVRTAQATSMETAENVWLGTAVGLSLFRGGGLSTVTTSQGLASDEILALAPAAKPEALWIGTPDGLSYLSQGRAITLTASDGLPDDNIRSLLLARDQTLWIGTSHGVASLPQADPAQTKSIHTYTQADGLGSNVIGSLLEDTDGSLWIGTLNGLGHLSQGRIHNYTAADGLTAGTITALGKGRSGHLWIGTSGGGLFSFDKGKIARVGTDADQSAGRLPSTIYGIVEDDTARVWLSSSTGIYRVASRDLELLASSKKAAAEIAIDHFDVADGLRLHDCASGGHPEAALTRQGLLWFATQKGASVVDTRDPLLDRPAPPIGIENITVDDASVIPDSDNRFKIPAGHARIAFHYAGLSLATPYKVRYRYQLDRFDHGWIDAGNRRTAYYTNIPPGRYTFRVVSSLNGGSAGGGEWSASAAAIEFTIAPHYYQTWWFYTLLGIMLAILAWQLYLYRLRQVELRFNAVLAERGRIAREIHDTLAQDIVAISVQLDLVSRLMTLSIDKAKAQLVSTRALVGKSLAEARSSIWDLRSPSATASDLPTRLRQAIRQVVADEPIILKVQITGTYRPASRELEDELLRIAQEAVTNAVRHAAPLTIDVSLTYDAHGVELRVHDDGRGFIVEPVGPAGHYGIRGMHERAERARAKLTIESVPGEGTTVLARAKLS